MYSNKLIILFVCNLILLLLCFRRLWVTLELTKTQKRTNFILSLLIPVLWPLIVLLIVQKPGKLKTHTKSSRGKHGKGTDGNSLTEYHI